MSHGDHQIGHKGRLSMLAAAWVVARRDFTAILFSRTFFFFLLGPLFPVIVGLLAGSVGQRVDQSSAAPAIGVVMAPGDAQAMIAARGRLAARLGDGLPEMRLVKDASPAERADPGAVMVSRKGAYAGVLSGSPAAPVLSGPGPRITGWQGDVALIAAEARDGSAGSWPRVRLAKTAVPPQGDSRSRLRTAQGAQTLLFLLTMMLAGMVLSNLVEEKGNKIIEVLAAAIPMEAVFFGKLFAMLGVSLVGIAVWGGVGGALYLSAGSALALPEPAVGWPALIGLGVVYFAMAYLLLGSVFLAIGSLANTVREVQTLSMPVTMMQLMLFFFATYAMTQPGSTVEMLAVILPFSSPFAMLARAAQEPALWPHAAALGWQAVWVLLLVRGGSALFRRRAMKSGPQGQRRKWWERVVVEG
ncbi:ABC transporter permease [Novosphingobium guangzhouense]|uniref:ABC transporter permease n=1 Tax=Novosphingobium guangzhouense TaxID=1850347 RepID=A0A2K2FZ90_9SPHN|nr:ABC transporter permease [Novosphingobium guangzhouense]PNU04100.1 ABC transporter permease [Novosphingobium guangzhouense]